jgi:hypothetical protein
MITSINNYWVHFSNNYLFLAGPEGLGKKNFRIWTQYGGINPLLLERNLLNLCSSDDLHFIVLARPNESSDIDSQCMNCRKLLSARQVLLVIIKGEYQIMVRRYRSKLLHQPLIPWQAKNDNFDNDGYYQ